MLRRRRPKPPEWRDRVDAARSTIVEHGRGSDVEARIAPVDAALVTAADDRDRLRTAIVALDPDRVARELKDALRAKAARGQSSPEEDALVDARRARYEAIQSLQNREEELAARIDATVAELERLAARALEASLTSRGAASDLDEELGHLSRHLVALEEAHEELRDL